MMNERAMLRILAHRASTNSYELSHRTGEGVGRPNEVVERILGLPVGASGRWS